MSFETGDPSSQGPSQNANAASNTQENTCDETKNSQGKTGPSGGKPKDRVPPHHRPPQQQHTAEQRHERHEWWSLAIQLLTLLAVIAYTSVTYLLLRETKKSADAAASNAATAVKSLQLTKKLISGTEAAYFRCQPELRQQTNPWIVISCTNKGQIPARNVIGTAYFTRTNFLGKIIHRDRRVIRRSSVGSNDQISEILPVGLPFDLRSYARENFTVNIAFSYFDGIENQRDTFCRSLVVEGGRTQPVSYGWETCDNAKERQEYPAD